MYSIFYSKFQQGLWTNNNLPPEIANIRHFISNSFLEYVNCQYRTVNVAGYPQQCTPIIAVPYLKKVAITELVTVYIWRL